MNQKGRDFLEKKITEVWQRETKLLVKPKEPSMETFFREANATGELKPLDPKQIRRNITKALKNSAIKFERLYNQWDDGDDGEYQDESNGIELSPWIVFKMPDAFKKAMDEYRESIAVYKKKITDLNNQKDNLLMKIQIGSDKMLAPLVDQVDSQGSLQLMNSRVILIEDTTKKLN